MAPIDRARCFAALSGPFDPVEAFAPRAERKSGDVAVVASQLAAMCDTHPQGAEGKWLMRTSERRDILKMLRDDNALDDYIAARRGAADAETEDLLDAILGNGLFAPADIEQAVASLESRGLIERIVVAVDRAGEIAPAYPLLQRARSALGLLDRRDRWEKLKAHGVYGRDDQRRVIDKWLKRPIVKAPVRALFVSGLPGIGKSLLLDDSVRAAFDSEHALLVRLDFDRAGLDVLDQLALTMEVARQVAEQIGERGPELLKKRLEAASFDARPDGPTLSEKSLFPSMLAGEIGAAAGNRPFLFLLDTMEVLRNRGETHPETLFVWLDRLVESGLKPMRVLAAGRGQPLDRIPKRIGQEIDLEGLADPAADAMLEQLGVPPEIRSEIQALADGNPLVLRLGAELASKAEPGAFREKRRKKELASAFLYRILLSRLNDKALLLVADPGLIVRRISAEVIREVLAPTLRLGRMSTAEAERLFQALKDQDWLVEPDPGAPGFLRHRPDIRAILLPLLYQGKPGTCARIDDAAVRWFARRSEPWCQVEAAYHQLQLMRSRPSPSPLIARDLLMRIDDGMMRELPEAAQDLVLSGRGERTTQLRGAPSADQAPDDLALVSELNAIIERQDWVEGAYVVENIVATAGIDARSKAADAVRAYWWRSGRWTRARRLLRERDALVSGDEDLRELPPAVALARLEMRAEFEPQKLRGAVCGNPEFTAFAMDLAVQSSDDIGRLGALAFLVVATSCDASPQRLTRSQEGDPVGAAMSYWNANRSVVDILQTLRDAHERMYARGATEDVAPGPATGPEAPPPAVARLLAVFNPYAAPVLNLSISHHYQWIPGAAEASDAKLVAARALMPWPASPAPSTGREHPVAGLARLGLFAEWAQAAAYFHNDPDVRLIGRSAEAWRRTAAGQWRYGSPPEGWVGSPGVDASIAHRLAALADAPDPVEAAMIELGLWSSDSNRDGERVWADLRRRNAGIFAERTEAAGDDPATHAAALLGRRVPAAFVPAAAILISRNA